MNTKFRKKPYQPFIWSPKNSAQTAVIKLCNNVLNRDKFRKEYLNTKKTPTSQVKPGTQNF